jgi:P-type Ca2+ transporter type 2C
LEFDVAKVDFAAANALIVPLHTAVPGRARFKVAGLHRNDGLKRSLELALTYRDGVRSASGSVLTGNILILFDPQITLSVVQGWLEDAVRARESSRASSALHEAPRAVWQGFAPEPPVLAEHRAPAWHRRPASEIATELETSLETGLTAAVAASRLAESGPNKLPAQEPRSKVDILLEQFNNLPVALLGAAAVLSLATGGLAEAVAIAGVIALNAGIGYSTESEAERTISALSESRATVVGVLRSGRRIEIPAEDVVLGDVLDLRSGATVAADARLITASRLTIDESALTGESLPATKDAAQIEGFEQAHDRRNLVFMGTTVVSGHGRAVVVARGRRTELGLINALVGEAHPPATPLQTQLEALGKKLVIVSATICGVVFALGLMRGYSLVAMLRSSVSLAIAAVPEGLPTVATTTLALGIRAMRQHKVLIRQLRAVETLGAVQVMCFDKTGTITFNRMTVAGINAGRHRLRIENGIGERLGDDELARLVEVGALCNEAQLRRVNGVYEVEGSPTEAALIRYALDCGIDVEGLRQRYPTLQIEHRAERQQFMVTTHAREHHGRLVAVKGSPAAVLELCSLHMVDGDVRPLSEEDQAAVAGENESMASEGLRVLGLASAVHDAQDAAAKPTERLCWLGLVGMTDPIRSGIAELVSIFHAGGIRTVMITGDQRATAQAVAKELGLNGTVPLTVVDAHGLASRSPEQLAKIAREATVFARVSPRHKLDIVRALQGAGQVTAMTGDGINDGPALKAADIGVAMGRDGTELARQVASVVLENDDLRIMLEAIRRGRATHANIRRSIRFILATNLSEIMVMLAATAFGIGQPLQPLQLLWINLISDVFPCLALAVEPPEPDIMRQPPRDRAEPIVRRSDLPRIGREAAVISGSALATYGYGLWRYGPGAPASTLAFSTLISAQLLHAWSCRSERHGILNPDERPANRYLDAAIIGSLALQALANFVPGLRALLGISRLGLMNALVVGAGALAPFVINEAAKLQRPIATGGGPASSSNGRPDAAG